MKRQQRQYVIWTAIAGVLFLIVALHDLFMVGPVRKSPFMLVLECAAAGGFLLNALLQWRNNR